MNAPIRTVNLSKRFRNREAVSQLNLEVPAGSIFGLIGPNGAGKTTTIKLLMNIVRPSAGSAEILGADSRHLGPAQFARIGYVSENQKLPDEMTVDYFLRYLKPFYPKWDDALAAELVRQFDLPRDRRLRHLSRGMRMKAALASSLAYRPELIVLDEPFSGLDALVRQEFIQGLLERAEETTILISSHDLAEIESFASHIAYVDNGRLTFAEDAAALADRFRNVEVVFDDSPAVPWDWPSNWVKPQTSSAVLRFVETRFDPIRTHAELSRMFPDARNIAFSPMTLKEIFLALAMESHRAAA